MNSGSLMNSHPHMFTRQVAVAAVLAVWLLFTTCPGRLSAQEPVRITSAQVDNAYELRAANDHVVPVYLNLDLASVTNLTPSVELPVGVLLEAGATNVPVLTLTPTTTRGRLAYRVSYGYAYGDPLTVDHQDDFGYLLPFEHGTKHRLSQGFNGAFTHYGENRYAVDFDMPIGTPVYAARGGLVAEVKEDSNLGGPSSGYDQHANRILVAHQDGSFGNYVHLRQHGAVVSPGHRVAAGELIGYSGNTGRSSGPHLHFDVRVPTIEGTNMSIPFRFAGEDGALMDPAEGRFYYAYHPGGPGFEAALGTDLSMDQFAEYRERIPVDGELTTRVEQVDLTFVLFIRNGLAESREVWIDLDLRGLSSDAGDPISITAPSGTEVVATILRPAPGATTIQYGYTVRY